MYFSRWKDSRNRKAKKKKSRKKTVRLKVGQGETHSKCIPHASSDLYYVFTYKHQMDPGSVNLKIYSDSLPHSPFEELSPE